MIGRLADCKSAIPLRYSRLKICATIACASTPPYPARSPRPHMRITVEFSARTYDASCGNYLIHCTLDTDFNVLQGRCRGSFQPRRTARGRQLKMNIITGLRVICMTVGLACGLKSAGQNLQTPVPQSNGASNGPAMLVANRYTNQISLVELQRAVRTNLLSQWDLTEIIEFLERDPSIGLPPHTHILITNLVPCALEVSDLKELQTLLNSGFGRAGLEVGDRCNQCVERKSSQFCCGSIQESVARPARKGS